MLNLVLAAIAFFGSHLILSSAPLREPLVRTLGERGFRAGYSTVAVASLIWLGFAYGAAPRQPLWDGAALRWVPVVVVPLAVLLAVGGLTQRNPTVVGQRLDADGAAAATGMLRVTRHPFLWGVALWAAAHLVVKGDLPSLVLFGGMLAFSLAGASALDAKKRRQWGDRWDAFAAVTSPIPFAAIIAGRNRLDLGEIGWARLAAAAAVAALLAWLHPWIAGVPIVS